MSTHTTPLPSAAAGPWRRLVTLGRDIKLSHSVFALPFALLATFLAAGFAGRLPDAGVLTLIVVCMVLARTVAMSVNRLADARLDAQNPRTAGRALPAGRLSRTFMRTIALACAAGFIAATAGFGLIDANWWPLALSPLVLAWLVGYSFTKRFTVLCHLFLGSALGLSPVAATVAVRPAALGHAAPYLLALLVTCWVAGFDVIYALQDVAFDRQVGLHSLPARLGTERALWLSRLLHVACLAALAALWWLTRPLLGYAFAAGIGVVVVLLVLEHALVWGSRTHRLEMAFFTVNGVISLLLGGLGIFDVVRRVLHT